MRKLRESETTTMMGSKLMKSLVRVVKEYKQTLGTDQLAHIFLAKQLTWAMIKPNLTRGAGLD